MAQLMRSRYDRKIAGVCGGLARAYNWDSTVVRLVAVALLVFGGGGLLAYVVCWIVMPEEPAGVPAATQAFGGQPSQPYAPPPTQPPYA